MSPSTSSRTSADDLHSRQRWRPSHPPRHQAWLSVVTAVEDTRAHDAGTEFDTNGECCFGEDGEDSDSSIQSIDVGSAITAQLEREAAQFIQPTQSSAPGSDAFDMSTKDSSDTATSMPPRSLLKTPLLGFQPGNKPLTPVTPPGQILSRSPGSSHPDPYDIECTSESDEETKPIPLSFTDAPKKDRSKTPVLNKVDERRSAHISGPEEDSPLACKSRSRALKAQTMRATGDVIPASSALTPMRTTNGQVDGPLTPVPTPDRPNLENLENGTARHGQEEPPGPTSSSSTNEYNASRIGNIDLYLPPPIISWSGGLFERIQTVSSRDGQDALTDDTGYSQPNETNVHAINNETLADIDTWHNNELETVVTSNHRNPGTPSAQNTRDRFGTPRNGLEGSWPKLSQYPSAAAAKAGLPMSSRGNAHRHIDVSFIPEDFGYKPSAGDPDPSIGAQAKPETTTSSCTGATDAKSTEVGDAHASSTSYTLQPSYGQTQLWPMNKPGIYSPHHRDTITNLYSILKGSELWLKQKRSLMTEQAVRCRPRGKHIPKLSEAAEAALAKIVDRASCNDMAVNYMACEGEAAKLLAADSLVAWHTTGWRRRLRNRGGVPAKNLSSCMPWKPMKKQRDRRGHRYKRLLKAWAYGRVGDRRY